MINKLLKNYLGFGFLHRSTSCTHAVVRYHCCVKNRLVRDTERFSPVFAGPPTELARGAAVL
ncbi:hypothetical protein PSEUDO8Z_100361 [Pseudomonas sp. 8Z]|nr:hypothetical protein PSEUDO8Z_100361 [Pseudomonas sp. 8Z]